MKYWLAVIFLLTGCDGAPLPTSKGGIVSTNPCIDSILVSLVAPTDIASISTYSHDAGSTSMRLDLAKTFPANGGTAEEIIALQPRIALLGAHTAPGTVKAIKGAGIATAASVVPDSVDASIADIRSLADAVGAVPAGERLITRIADAAAPKATVEAARPSLLIWADGGLVPGHGTLADDMIRRAGFHNASADYGLNSWDILPLEPLVDNPPDIILTVADNGKHALSSGRVRSLFLREAGRSIRVEHMPGNLLFCGGPTIIEAMTLLKSLHHKDATS